MKRKPTLSQILLLTILLYTFSCQGEKEKVKIEKRNPKLEETAREIMTAAYYCSLITLDENDQPRARIMEPFPPEEDMTIWLATNPKSRKVKQLKNNSKATLQYFDKGNLGYVTLMGNAYLVHDEKAKQKYWRDSWESFYANQKEAYMLIKFVPNKLEVISTKHGINGDSLTWQPSGSSF